MEVREHRAGCRELARRSLLRDSSVSENDDMVCAPYGAQAVCDDYHGELSFVSKERVLNCALRKTVEGVGGFVENQDLRTAQERAREPDTLALATGEAQPAVTHEGLIASITMHINTGK
jgi:hypothetical protein